MSLSHASYLAMAFRYQVQQHTLLSPKLRLMRVTSCCCLHRHMHGTTSNGEVTPPEPFALDRGEGADSADGTNPDVAAIEPPHHDDGNGTCSVEDEVLPGAPVEASCSAAVWYLSTAAERAVVDHYKVGGGGKHERSG